MAASASRGSTRAHRDHDRIALDRPAALEHHAARCSRSVVQEAAHRAMPKLGALHLGGAQQPRREGTRLDQRRGVGRAEPAGDRDSVRHPRASGPACRLSFGRHAAECLQTSMAPWIAERFREFGVQGEAAPRQPVERRAAAPVERQEAAGLARGRAGHLMALDHDGRCAAFAEEVGRRGADRAAAADHDPPGPFHPQKSSGRRVPGSTTSCRP